MNTNGSWKLQNSASGLIGSNSAVTGAGVPVRLEWGVTGGNAMARGYFDTNIDGTTPDWEVTATAITQSTVRRIWIGGTASLVWSANIDDDGKDNTTWVGPKAGSGPSFGSFTWQHAVTIG
jgi:hypothetical protein